jgi:hypothetical protein
VVLAKLGAGAAAVTLGLMLLAYMPPLKVLVKNFMPPETWVGFIETDFDRYVKYMVRTARKTKPLERYKRLHAIAVPSMGMGMILVIAAFFLR